MSLAEAGRRSLRVAFNIAPPDERIADYDLSAVTALILNPHEASALTDERDIPAILSRLTQRYPQALRVVTQGKSGLHFAEAQRGDYQQLPAYRVDAVDETAAGDAFIGFLLGALDRGADLPSALTEASAAGALAVTVAGAATSIPTTAAVASFITNHGALL